MAVLFVTHDLGLVAELCDRVVVMYAGEIVEEIGTGQLWNGSRHPYTRALLACLPQEERLGIKLSSIPGSVASAALQTTGCRFYPRCGYAEEDCRTNDIALRPLDSGRVRCRRAEEIRAGEPLVPA